MVDNLTIEQYNEKRAIFDRLVADQDFVSAWTALAKHHLTTKLNKDFRIALEKELSQAINFPEDFRKKWEVDFSKVRSVVNP